MLKSKESVGASAPRQQKSQTFMYGAVILMISNILVKAIGACFKIPLQNLIKSDGMAYFQAAYNIYVSFYMISTAGIPVAISRMIATSHSQGNEREVNKIFKIAYWVFFGVGVLGTVLMIAFAGTFAKAAKLDDSVYAMCAIAPTLFFICLSSAYRGYFQGLRNMSPTAVSQVIESVGKLSIGLIAGWFCLKRGYPIHIVAAYVISGVTIGVIAATLYIMVIKKMYTVADSSIDSSMPVRSTRDLFYELVIISIPISLASSIMGLTNVVDTMLVTRRLIDAGYAYDVAVKCYGSYSMPLTLFNMPTTLIYPFAISALPTLSTYYSSSRMDEAKKLMDSTFRVSSIVAFPCALGMSAMAYPILSLLYHAELIDETKTNLDYAAPCLAILALAIFFLGMIAVTNSMLQAFHLQNKTIIATACGIVMKIISEYILVGIGRVGLTGAAVSTAVCYFTIMAINLWFLITRTQYRPRIASTFLKPFLSAVICVIPCLLVYKVTTRVGIGSKIACIASIGVAGVVYLVALLLMRGAAEEDLRMLPKSDKVIAVLKKAHLLS